MNTYLVRIIVIMRNKNEGQTTSPQSSSVNAFFDGIQSEMAKKRSRRTWVFGDIPKFTGILATTALLAACGPDPVEEVSLADTRFEPIPEHSKAEYIHGQNGDFRIITYEVKHLKAHPTKDTQPEEAKENEVINRALDTYERVIRLQKKNPPISGKEDTWREIILPGSPMHACAINFFGYMYERYGYTKEDQPKAGYFSMVFDPGVTVGEKIDHVMRYLDGTQIPLEFKKQIKDYITTLHPYCCDIPDNVPLDVLFDIFTAARSKQLPSDQFNPLVKAANETGTCYGAHIPKLTYDQVETKREMKNMFIAIDPDKLKKPHIYTVQNPDDKYQIKVYFGPKDTRNKAYNITAEQLHAYKDVSNSSLPSDFIAEADKKGVVQEINPAAVAWGWVPQGSQNKGTIEPVVFLDNPDLSKSKVLIASNGSIVDRVNWWNKSWITDVTKSIEESQKNGIAEVFRYGLIGAKQLFERMFKGGDPLLGMPNLALMPNDKNLVQLLAGLFMGGKQRSEWGVATSKIKVKHFSGTNTVLPDDFGEHEVKWGTDADAYELESGAFYNLIWDSFAKQPVISFATRETSKGIEGTQVDGIGNPLHELINTVQVMSAKDNFTEVLEILGKVVPWAATAIALVIPPAKVLSPVWKVLTWAGAKVAAFGL